MREGTIKDIKDQKGFGFIRCEDGREFFFHQSGLVNCEFESLRKGDKVTFEEVSSPKGPRAEQINLVD